MIFIAKHVSKGTTTGHNLIFNTIRHRQGHSYLHVHAYIWMSQSSPLRLKEDDSYILPTAM